jgi:hypothetical protein
VTGFVKHCDAIDRQLLHTCEDGHSWREQADGGVSPSWGCALTSVHFAGHDQRWCPEPARDEEGRFECPGCGGRFWSGHGTPGVMADPWTYDERCVPAPPACGKPPVRTRRWDDDAGNWVDYVELGEQLTLGVAA